MIRLKINLKSLAVTALAGLIIFTFFPATQYGFTNYDDPLYIVNNVHLQDLNWHKILWAFTDGYAGNWHPLTWLSYMAEIKLFGLNPRVFHTTNLILHLANTFLLLLVLKKMTGAFWRSLFVSALFALHPLHVESVVWISERKDLLSTFFWMFALWAYARYAAPEQKSSKRRITDYYLALLFFALGLMSKAMVVTLPFVLLLLDFWPLRRMDFSLSKLRRLTLEKVPFLVLSIVVSVITFVLQDKASSVSSLRPMAYRLANTFVGYTQYLEKTFWPADLAILYPLPRGWPINQVAFSGILIAGICYFSIWLSRRSPYIFVGWCWFLGTLVPVIGLVPIGMQSMADRYSYVPIIGVFIAVTWLVSDLLSKIRPAKRTGGIIVALALAVCVIVSQRQIQLWQTTESLFRHAIKVTSGNYYAHYVLGLELMAQNKPEEADSNFRTALRINPGYYRAHSDLGILLAQAGKTNDALEQFTLALQKEPNYADAHYNLAILLESLGRLDEANLHYARASKLEPSLNSK